ncbi:hypothetical protein BDB00DRAFT_826494 [Zychaea mexicana]|uniref:uncharacterized protein n=1 Tax=Zychaea mexicana TaxID=64656 RepID=UPI0022FE12AE|nr:uncharacterized protein BDB00DRAFT_826494 [Zychaea mexicana]KAI9492803.1 hypothetical protein BDB00DRAFT_826494 [Zychaea mexicana]
MNKKPFHNMPPKRGTKRNSKDKGKKEEEPPQKKNKGNEEQKKDVTTSETKSTSQDKPTVLEKGHIYFLYRPKMDTEGVSNVDDVQKVYTVLKPYWSSCKPKRENTLIVLGKKKLPETQRHSRYWGFVAEASDNIDDVAGAFKEHSYETKTRGERTVQPARPVGEGVYEIATHNGHSHLAYMLTLPDKPQDVQKAFNIQEQASIVISVKNPDSSAPAQAGLPKRQKAEFPDELKELFENRRFVDMATTTEFLNYSNCELMLVGATEKIETELGNAGKELEKMEKEDEEHVDYVGADQSVFDELELSKKENPIEPLKGEWT